MELCLAINYGSRREILLGIQKYTEEVMAHKRENNLTEDEFSNYLFVPEEIDLMIRTSGELRISNYLLWQIAYAELIFTNVAWPDFDENELKNVLNSLTKEIVDLEGLVHETKSINRISHYFGCVFPLWLGGIFLEALALFIVCAGAYEWMHVQADFKSWPPYILPLSVLAVLLTRFLSDNYLIVVLTIIVLILWSMVVFVENFSIIDSFICMAYVFIFTIVYHAIGLIVMQHQYLWTIVFATYGSDTGAYLVGCSFGKHKMNPRISLRKVGKD